MHLTDAFINTNLNCMYGTHAYGFDSQGMHVGSIPKKLMNISSRIPWESNPHEFDRCSKS